MCNVSISLWQKESNHFQQVVDARNPTLLIYPTPLQFSSTLTNGFSDDDLLVRRHVVDGDVAVGGVPVVLVGEAASRQPRGGGARRLPEGHGGDGEK